MPIDPQATSSYLQNLPAIFSEDPFLGRFLLAFEQVLTGLPGLAGREPVPSLGLEEIIATIATLFDPQETREEFLPWLASWVALGLRADLDELRQRDFIARVVSLYRLRGTKQGLEELVRIYTRLGATVNELHTPFQIGVHSTIGVDTLLDGGAPHFFRVLIRLTTPDPEQIRQHRQVVTAIIDMEKPAHTYYELDVETPTLQIGVHSRIGVDTLLGPSPH